MDPHAWQQHAHHFAHNTYPIFFRDDGEGEPLILIHGFPTSSWDWHQLWPALTARYRVVAPDLIGFGLSAKPRDYAYSLFDQADLIERLCTQCGITHAHVLAHDYGDTVAQELIARHAEGKLSFALRSVCLLNGGIVPGVHRPVLMQRLLHGPLGRFIGPLMNERTLRRSFTKIFGPNTQPSDDEMRHYWHFIAHNDGPRVVHLLIRYMAERRQNQERWVGALRDPRVPLRLIFGEVDPISGRHMADAFRALNPAPDVIDLPNIGHYPQCEAPERILQHFLSFLDDGRA